MNPFDALSFEQVLWLVPVLFAIHNAEEAPGMARWQRGLPLSFHPVETTRQFLAAVIPLTLGGFLLTWLGLQVLPQPAGILSILGMQMILLVNAVVPHLAATLRFRRYSPGVVTGLLLNIPFSIYLFRRAGDEGILTPPAFWMLLVAAPFLMVLLTLLFLRLGKWIDSLLTPSSTRPRRPRAS